MNYLITIYIAYIGLFGIANNTWIYAKENVPIEEIYSTCAIVESTVETVVNYRDKGTDRNLYHALVDQKMNELGTNIRTAKKVHWFIDYIYDRPDKDVHELESDIDFICKSELMDGDNAY